MKDKEYYTRIPNHLFKDLRSGKISPSMFVALSILHHWSDWGTGRVGEASAGGLETWSAKAYCEDTFQRALQRAEAQGYIDRSEMVLGSKQSYPITLHNYPALIEEVDELPNGDVRIRRISEVINPHETSWWKESSRGKAKDRVSSTDPSTDSMATGDRKGKAYEVDEEGQSTQSSTEVSEQVSAEHSTEVSAEMSDKPRLNRASNQASSESEKEGENNTSTRSSAVFVLSNPKPKSKPESMSDGNLQVPVAVEAPVSIPAELSISIPVKSAVPTLVPAPPVPSAPGDSGTVMPAKFAGTCHACGNRIACGEMILLKDGEKARHVSCPPAVHAPAPSPKRRLRGKTPAAVPPRAADPPHGMTPRESRKTPVPCRTTEGIRPGGKGTPQGRQLEPPPKKACPPEQEKEQRKNAAYYFSSFNRKAQGVTDKYGYVEETMAGA